MTERRGDEGGVAGNTFQGNTAAQSGPRSTQYNLYLGEQRGDRGRPRLIAVLLVAALAAGALTWGLVQLSGRGGSSAAGKGGPVPSGVTPPSTSASPRSADAQPSRTASQGDVPAPSASVSPPSNGIQWTGSVRISEYGPMLDKNPPGRSRYGFEADVQLGLVDPPRLSSDDPTLALWSGRGMPTRQDCSDLVNTKGVTMVEAKAGSVICLTTKEGRTAVLTITSISNQFSTGVLAQASVWSEAGSGA
ncbi:hypothetical protein [Streptomyces sp. NPDC127190]|uniref:hypothetical protein n=1 Tax=unclassified Streptomyces TaxID=2593676 RepID=UPI0036364652